MTNGDKFRAMTDGELAAYFAVHHRCDFCPTSGNGSDCPGDLPVEDCFSRWERYLNRASRQNKNGRRVRRRRNRRDAGTAETPEPPPVSGTCEEPVAKSPSAAVDLYDRMIEECKKRGYDVDLMLGLARVLPNLRFTKIRGEHRAIYQQDNW